MPTSMGRVWHKTARFERLGSEMDLPHTTADRIGARSNEGRNVGCLAQCASPVGGKRPKLGNGTVFFSWIAFITPIIFPVMFMLLAYRFALIGLLASQLAVIAQTSVKSFGSFDQPPTESSLLLTQVQ